MPPIVIPYASSAPYDNSAYVTRMADLMLRRGDLQADALRRAGDARAQMWGNVGNVALSTMSQIGAARDAERQRAILQQQQAFENQMKERDYDMREREMLAAADERKAGREWQQQQFRDTQARYSADDLAPGSMVSPEGYQRDFAGTSAARRFEHRDAEAARLPARSTVDGMLVPGFRAQNPDDELITPETMGSTISPDVAARPERFVRVPNWQERQQANELDLRQRANELAALNTIADNRRADAAAKATEAYRNARLQQGDNRQPTTATLALAAARGDANAQKALDIIRRTEDGRSPQQIQNFMTISGQYQRSPLVAAADRAVILSDSIKAVQEKPDNPTAQLNLAYSYIQALDTYQSAVREGELQNLGVLGTRLDQLRVEANRIATTGAFMSPEVAQDIAVTSERLVAAIESAKRAKAQDFGRRARVAGVGDMWDAYIGDNTSLPEPNAPQQQGFFGDPARQPRPRK